MEFKTFDLTQALKKASIGFKSSDNKLELYIVNFNKNSGDSDFPFSGIGSKDNITYKFNYTGLSSTDKQLYLIQDEIKSSLDTISTRVDDTGKEVSYNISTMLPKDHMAMSILNGILSKMPYDEIESLSDARITQMSVLAYKMAQSMINTAANNRKNYGKPDENPEEPTNEVLPTDNTEKLLLNIETKLNNINTTILEKGAKIGDTTNSFIVKLLYPISIASEEGNPIYIKNVDGGGSSGGGGSTTSSDITIRNTTDLPIPISTIGSMLIEGVSSLGGGLNLSTIIDSQAQSNIGAIPIKIEGGLLGIWSILGDDTPYSPNKIQVIPPISLGLSSSDSSLLILSIPEATKDNSGLISSADLTELRNLSTWHSNNGYNITGHSGEDLLTIINIIDLRLKALEP